MGLDLAEFIMEVEDKYEIRLHDDRPEWPALTVRSFISAVLTAIKEQHPGRMYDETIIFYDVKELLSHRFVIEPEKIVMDARFVEDLGLD